MKGRFTVSGYGYFGSIAEKYDKFRPLHSDEIITYCCSLTKFAKPKILDLGCGTGISTRQLVGVVEDVIGCDKDEKMLGVAVRHDSANIKYAAGAAENLPFKSDYFDAVTAFSAFHWFMNQESVTEIKRVLVPKGVFAVINRNKIGISREIQKRVREIIQGVATRKISDIKKQYKPAEFIRANRFDQIQEKIFSESVPQKPADIILGISTSSIVNEIPHALQERTLAQIEDFLNSIVNLAGFIEWSLEVRVVSGVNV